MPPGRRNLFVWSQRYCQQSVAVLYTLEVGAHQEVGIYGWAADIARLFEFCIVAKFRELWKGILPREFH